MQEDASSSGKLTIGSREFADATFARYIPFGCVFLRSQPAQEEPSESKPSVDPPDEPMFVLLGRDKHAPQLVELWAGQRASEGEDPAKVEEVLKCAKAMRKWRYDRKGAPQCEYCDPENEFDCTTESKMLVCENGFLWWYWCRGPETVLATHPSYVKDTRFMTIEEYFATDEVQNEYCQDEGLRVYHETKAMRARANEAVMGDESVDSDAPESGTTRVISMAGECFVQPGRILDRFEIVEEPKAKTEGPSIDEVVRLIKRDSPFWAPEVRVHNLLPYLHSYGDPLYDALMALPDDERKGCGVNEIVVTNRDT
jgi:hypothetical protein